MYISSRILDRRMDWCSEMCHAPESFPSYFSIILASVLLACCPVKGPTRSRSLWHPSAGHRAHRKDRKHPGSTLHLSGAAASLSGEDGCAMHIAGREASTRWKTKTYGDC